MPPTAVIFAVVKILNIQELTNEPIRGQKVLPFVVTGGCVILEVQK